MAADDVERVRWFQAARYGLFIHWGPYAAYGRGEQVLFRERLDQAEYARAACAWRPRHYRAADWAAAAREGGFRYAVLTTRHHDGYCLWDTATTDYGSARQAAGRDLVGEFVEAFRAAGLRVGLYYSLADWRFPAYWEGPGHDPEGFRRFIDYVHRQVEELCTRYGTIDVLWFDGAWPHAAPAWRAQELVARIRELQPGILVNNRLDWDDCVSPLSVENAGASHVLGDFGTPEHHITAVPGRPWESCNTSTYRLWGYTAGEHWRPAEELLEMLINASVKGGNLLLNVGPDADGQIPVPFLERSGRIGRWLARHGECLLGTEPGDVCEFITYGFQTRKADRLYLIVRFWDGRGVIRLAGLATRVRRAVFLSTGEELAFRQTEDEVTIEGLPPNPPVDLYPVIRLECEGRPEARPWARERLWTGDPCRMTDWARARGTSGWVDGRERQQ